MHSSFLSTVWIGRMDEEVEEKKMDEGRGYNQEMEVVEENLLRKGSSVVEAVVCYVNESSLRGWRRYCLTTT